MKMTHTQLTARLAAANRTARARKTVLQAAKVEFKKARKALKVARKEAKAARKAAAALQDTIAKAEKKAKKNAKGARKAGAQASAPRAARSLARPRPKTPAPISTVTPLLTPGAEGSPVEATA
jgi:hypothetical protein